MTIATPINDVQLIALMASYLCPSVVPHESRLRCAADAVAVAVELFAHAAVSHPSLVSRIQELQAAKAKEAAQAEADAFGNEVNGVDR